MNVQISREFTARMKSLEWDEVKVAIQLGYLHVDSAVDYAIKLIENGSVESIVLELASYDFGDTLEIQDCLNRLKSNERFVFNKKKWAMILLTFGFEHRDELAEPLQFIEEIYAEFDYPEEIAHLVRYMPYEGHPRNLMQDWEHFIDMNVYGDLVFRNQNP